MYFFLGPAGSACLYVFLSYFSLFIAPFLFPLGGHVGISRRRRASKRGPQLRPLVSAVSAHPRVQPAAARDGPTDQNQVYRDGAGHRQSEALGGAGAQAAGAVLRRDRARVGGRGHQVHLRRFAHA